MIIRLATLEDIEPIMNLVREIVPVMRASGNFQWDDVYPNAGVFEKDVALKQLWVADVDGGIGGFSAITTDQEAEYANVGWDINEPAIVTHRLAVSIHYRRQGIAEALLKQAEIVAIARGINILRIDTNSNNKATRLLFPKLGYEYAGEIGLSFRPNLRFYCYEKILGAGQALE
jgi:ribosomal protein S18 acetylase RimI-like enzyme